MEAEIPLGGRSVLEAWDGPAGREEYYWKLNSPTRKEKHFQRMGVISKGEGRGTLREWG